MDDTGDHTLVDTYNAQGRLAHLKEIAELRAHVKALKAENKLLFEVLAPADVLTLVADVLERYAPLSNERTMAVNTFRRLAARTQAIERNRSKHT